MFTQPSAKELSPERRDTVDKLRTQLDEAYFYQTEQQHECNSNSDSQSGEVSTSTKETGLQRLYEFQKLFP